LAAVIEDGAQAAGFDTERWTLRRIAAVIARQLGVRYHPRYLERPLKVHGFSVQRPATQARERDEYVIARWPTREWVALQKRRVGAASPSSWSTRPGTPSAPGRG
jgi:putative transposase